MSKTYESMVLLDNREVKKGWQTLKDSVSSLFQKHGAEVVSARRWDERRLAYPIRSQPRGTYLLLYFKADTDTLVGIRRDLEYSEPVLRHLMMVCEEVPQEAFEPEAEFDEAALRGDDTESRPRSAKDSDEAGTEKKAEEPEREPASAEGESETAESKTKSETKTKTKTKTETETETEKKVTES